MSFVKKSAPGTAKEGDEHCGSAWGNGVKFTHETMKLTDNDCRQKNQDALNHEAKADEHSLGEQIFSRAFSIRELKPYGV